MPVRVWGPGSDQFGPNDAMHNAEYDHAARQQRPQQRQQHPPPKNQQYGQAPQQHHRQYNDDMHRNQMQHQMQQRQQQHPPMQQQQMRQHHMGGNAYETTGMWEPGAGWVPPPPQNYARMQQTKAPAPRSFQREKPIGDGQLKPLKLKARVDEADVELPEMSSLDGTRYVIIEMKGCDRGPPLIPVNNKWCAPEDCSMPLRAYLVALADRNGGAITAVDKIDGRCLPRYQCAVRAEKWQDTWNIVRKSFLEMRSAYRFIRGGKNAPNLWFGMPARFLEPGLGSNGNSNGNGNSNASTVASNTPSVDGERDRASLWQLTQERLAEQEAALQSERGMYAEHTRGGYPSGPNMQPNMQNNRGNYHTLLLHTQEDNSTWAPWTNSTTTNSVRTNSTRTS